MGLGGVPGGVAGGGLGECVKTLSWNVVGVSNAVSLSPVNVVQGGSEASGHAVSLSPVNIVRLSTLEQVQPGEGEACCPP